MSIGRTVPSCSLNDFVFVGYRQIPTSLGEIELALIHPDYGRVRLVAERVGEEWSFDFGTYCCGERSKGWTKHGFSSEPSKITVFCCAFASAENGERLGAEPTVVYDRSLRFSPELFGWDSYEWLLVESELNGVLDSLFATSFDPWGIKETPVEPLQFGRDEYTVSVYGIQGTRLFARSVSDFAAGVRSEGSAELALRVTASDGDYCHVRAALRHEDSGNTVELIWNASESDFVKSHVAWGRRKKFVRELESHLSKHFDSFSLEPISLGSMP